MQVYVMVSADFPNINSAQRGIIYRCLTSKQWNKIENVGRDISTTWYAKFTDDTAFDAAINATKREFQECSKPYTTPKIAIHVGPRKPVY